MPKRQIPWAHIFLEAMFVVLGVVLAFAANEWRTNRADRAAGVAAATSITEEIKLNRGAVHNSLVYHMAVVDSLSAFQRRSTSPQQVPSINYFPRGFISQSASGLLSTAWEVASTTGVINHVPYDDIVTMSRVYDRQSAYQEQAKTTGDILFEKIYDGGTESVLRNYRNHTGILLTFIYVECALLEQYDDAIRTLRTEDTDLSLPTVERCTYFRR